MKSTIHCDDCEHSVKLQEDERVRAVSRALVHLPNGGHQYTVGIKVGLSGRSFDA